MHGGNATDEKENLDPRDCAHDDTGALTGNTRKCGGYEPMDRQVVRERSYDR